MEFVINSQNRIYRSMMKKMPWALVVILAVTITMCPTQCHALAGTSSGRPRYIEGFGGSRIIPREDLEFLKPHNKARAVVGVAPLKWSPYLARSAAETVWSIINNNLGCYTYVDPRSLNGTYDIGGSNHFWDGYGELPPRAVVKRWVAGKKYYNHANNSCAPTKDNEYWCDAYTQVVWRKSLELGCAQVRCFADEPQGTAITICFYSPRGNVPWERPY